MKPCTKCKRSKRLSAFYKTAAGKSLASCKSCVREQNNEYKRTHRKTQSAYQRQYTKRHPEVRSVARRNWERSNPHKKAAHRLVAAAIARRTLKKQGCEKCGVERVDAHHDDYSKPLVVRWLCRLHHKAAHAEQLSK